MSSQRPRRVRRSEDAHFEGLKQFVATTVGQTESRLSQQIEELRNEMKEGFAGVAETLSKLNNDWTRGLTTTTDS